MLYCGLERDAELGDWTEAFAVQGARTVVLKRVQVICGSVSFVAGKPVLGIVCIEAGHQAVTVDLGYDGGRRDAGLEPVSSDHASGRAWQFTGQGVAVDQTQVSAARKSGNRTGHSFESCLQNVVLVDEISPDLSNMPCKAGVENLPIENFAFGWREFFAIVDVLYRASWIENDGGDNHWSRKRASAGLINSDQSSGNRTAGQIVIVEEAHASLTRTKKSRV